MRSDTIYWVWLNSIPMLGPVKSQMLLKYFGNPEAIWKASREQLEGLTFINSKIVKSLTDEKHKAHIDDVFYKLDRQNIKVITLRDKTYPQNLKMIYDPPTILYTRGDFSADEKILAIVGSRNSTPYGLKMAERFSHELALNGITIISGMARGIDSCAHRGAIAAGGRTIAVLGCGVDMVYPYENRELMNQIINNGAVISEYGPGTPPVSGNFPARNRIISGIALGILVVEAGEKSGSLITSGLALEQGREVFALPGNIDNINSKGTNALIKDGAKMVTCVDDILDELEITRINFDYKWNVALNDSLFKTLDDDEKSLALLLSNGPLHIDVLCENSGFSMQKTNSMLVIMELKGILKQTQGKIFELKI